MAKKRRRHKNRATTRQIRASAAPQEVIRLTPDQQLALWNALNEAAKLTAAQRRLGAIMRGEA